MPRIGIAILAVLTLLAGSPGRGQDIARTDAYGEPLPDRAIARLGPARHLYEDQASCVVVPPDGTVLVAGAYGKLIRLYALQGCKPAGPVHKLRGHAGRIERLAFSPDGRWLASADDDGVICLWEVKGAHELRTLTGHGGSSTSTLAFSRDGKLLAAGTERGVTVWETPTGKRRQSLAATESVVQAIAFSPDGKSLAAGEKKGRVCLWNIDTGKVVLTLPDRPKPEPPVAPAIHPLLPHLERSAASPLDFHRGGIKALAFSADGKYLAAAGGTLVRIWEPKREKLLHELRLHARVFVQFTGSGIGDGPRESGGVVSIEFMPDGKTLASLGSGGAVILTDAAIGKQVCQFNTSTHSARGMAVSADGKRLATHDGAFRLAVYDGTDGKLLAKTGGHRSCVHSVAFSADGKLLASGGDDAAVRLWDVAGRKQVAEAPVLSYASSVAFSPRGKFLAAQEYIDRLRLWRVAREGATLTSVRKNEIPQSVRGIAFSPDGRELAVLHRHAGVDFFRLDKPAFARRLNMNTIDVASVSYSPDGKRLAFGYRYARFKPRIVDAADGRPIREMSVADPQPADHVVFSPDGMLLASAGYRSGSTGQAKVYLWDAATGRLYMELKGHEKTVLCAAFSPDGRVIAAAGQDPAIRLWEVAGGKLLAALHGHERQVRSLAFSPDGKMLSSAGWDSSILLWDVDQIVCNAAPPRRHIDKGSFAPGVITGLWQRKIDHPDRVYAVAFSPDGKTVASGCDDKVIRLFDVGTGKLLRELKGHESGLRSLAFSPDGKTLASGSWNFARDHTVRLWDVATGRNIAKHKGIGGFVESVAFSPDGRMLATTAQRYVPLWEVGLGKPAGRIPLRGRFAFASSLAFSPDGRFLLTGATAHAATLWDISTRTPLFDWPVVEDERSSIDVHGVAFSPDSRIAATGGSDGTVRLWDTATGRRLGQRAYPGKVFSLGCSPRGKLLAAGGAAGISLWEVDTDRLLLGLRPDARSICFSPDGKLLASGSWSAKALFLWDLNDFGSTPPSRGR